MDYRQARHILDRLPFRDVKPGLDRTHRLLDALGHPESAVPAIHVAGTNGKGSVAAMLSGILHRAGFHVGRYTSPELVDFRDRICVDGAFIPADALAAGVEAILPVLQATGDTPTLFEALTAVALWHFAREHVDLAVVEVGLGGRFDATNAVRPILSILTTVGRDHLALLGDTIERIAWEKAGIAKPGVPFLAGALCREAMDVVQTACAEVGAPLLLADSVPLERVAFDWDGATYASPRPAFPSASRSRSSVGSRPRTCAWFFVLWRRCGRAAFQSLRLRSKRASLVLAGRAGSRWWPAPRSSFSTERTISLRRRHSSPQLKRPCHAARTGTFCSGSSQTRKSTPCAARSFLRFRPRH